MTRGDKVWKGFDYGQGLEVTRTRAEWRALIEQSTRTEHVATDLALFHEGEMTHDIWDARRSNFD